MTVSLCHHSHSVLPPNGSIFNPGPCTNCGITWDEVQDEIQRQNEALILGTAHDGDCPHCSHHKKLLRFQPPARPWHDFDYEPPVTFLCIPCWNAAAKAEDQAADALIHSI